MYYVKYVRIKLFHFSYYICYKWPCAACEIGVFEKLANENFFKSFSVEETTTIPNKDRS